MKIWKPSKDWLRRHTSSDLCYEVHLELQPASAAEQVWQVLAADHEGTEDAIHDGGAVIRRGGRGVLVAVSGGEDALDSLDFCVNDTIGDALSAVAPQARVEVVGESRELRRD